MLYKANSVKSSVLPFNVDLTWLRGRAPVSSLHYHCVFWLRLPVQSVVHCRWYQTSAAIYWEQWCTTLHRHLFEWVRHRAVVSSVCIRRNHRQHRHPLKYMHTWISYWSHQPAHAFYIISCECKFTLHFHGRKWAYIKKSFIGVI